MHRCLPRQRATTYFLATVTPNQRFEVTAASELAVPSSLRSSAAPQPQR